MATEVLKTFGALQEELQKAREGLRSVDDSIKRIIGRDPEAPAPLGGPPRPGQKRPAGPGHVDEFQGRGRGFPFQGRGGRISGPGHGPGPGHGQNPAHGLGHGPAHGLARPQEDDGSVLIRRRVGDKTVFSRLSGPPAHKYIKKEEEEDEGDEDDLQHKPAISSRVIPQVRELPTKEDIIAAQGDERSKARNRRMFGALLGTLQKFRQEETMMRDREDKKAQVEKKLEEAAKREKEELKKERYELFQDRRRKQQEIRRIEYKILRVKEQDQWEARHRPLLNFIQTKTKPPIFYLPKIHNSKTEERLVASQKVIAKMMEKKRSSLQEELDRLEHRNESKAGTTDAQPFVAEEEDEEHAAEGAEQASDSPPENKENRLRSLNVKIEKEVEQKVTMTGKIVRPEVEKKSEPDKKQTPDRRDNQRRYGHRDRHDHHSKSRDPHSEGRHNDRENERDHRGKTERGRPRERARPREKRSDSGDKVEVKQESDDKWNRKRANEESNDIPIDSAETEVDVPGAELSSISLPGEAEGESGDHV